MDDALLKAEKRGAEQWVDMVRSVARDLTSETAPSWVRGDVYHLPPEPRVEYTQEHVTPSVERTLHAPHRDGVPIGKEWFSEGPKGEVLLKEWPRSAPGEHWLTKYMREEEPKMWLREEMHRREANGEDDEPVGLAEAAARAKHLREQR